MDYSRNKNSVMQPTRIYHEARKRYRELMGLKKQLEQELQGAPEGKIHVAHSEARTQYYLRKAPTEKTGTYLSQSQLPEIQTYLQKSYNEKILKLISKETSGLEKFLKQCNDNDIIIQKIYSDYPNEVKKLVSPIDMACKDYEDRWLAIPYIKKSVSENVPIYITNNQEHVRSKSELNIANALEKNGVPYKYECPLQLKNGSIIYPDFTIYNSKNREIYYWEHRGMMDDRDYARHSVKRLKDYAKNGIFPGMNLIITEETAMVPLGTDEIFATINIYFK